MRQNQHFTKPNRRSFLTSSAGAVGAIFAGSPWMPALAATPLLSVASRTLEVNKKAATVFSVLGRDGKTDESIRLLKIAPVDAEYWDNSGIQAISYAFEAARAYIKGVTPASSEKQHGKIAM